MFQPSYKNKKLMKTINFGQKVWEKCSIYLRVDSKCTDFHSNIKSACYDILLSFVAADYIFISNIKNKNPFFYPNSLQSLVPQP